jgi:hypothetical protein
VHAPRHVVRQLRADQRRALLVGGLPALRLAADARARPDHQHPQRRRHLLLARRARTALGTATQCTRRNDSPASPPPPPPPCRGVRALHFLRRAGVAQVNLSPSGPRPRWKRPAHISFPAARRALGRGRHLKVFVPPRVAQRGFQGLSELGVRGRSPMCRDHLLVTLCPPVIPPDQACAVQERGAAVMSSGLPTQQLIQQLDGILVPGSSRRVSISCPAHASQPHRT